MKKKVDISFAMMKGKVEPLAAKILFPFYTGQSLFNKAILNKIPRRANLIFTGIKGRNGKMEYVFDGVDMRCWCDDCQNEGVSSPTAQKTKKET